MAGFDPSAEGTPSRPERPLSPIRMCRKRSFGTYGRGCRPASAAVCRIPCLILCLADVERVCQCRAPNAPRGLHGRVASVIASRFSSSRTRRRNAPTRPRRCSAAPSALDSAVGSAYGWPADIATTTEKDRMPSRSGRVNGCAVLRFAPAPLARPNHRSPRGGYYHSQSTGAG